MQQHDMLTQTYDIVTCCMHSDIYHQYVWDMELRAHGMSLTVSVRCVAHHVYAAPTSALHSAYTDVHTL